MNRYVPFLIPLIAAAILAAIWVPYLPELVRSGVPSITENAEYALNVRLTGFVIVLALAFFFALRRLRP